MVESKKAESNGIPLAEWIVAAAGLLLVSGSLVFLAYRAMTEDLPPAFEAELADVVVIAEDTYLAEIRIHNRGGAAVASLRVIGEVKGEQSRQKEVTVDYLPGHSSRKVGLLFATRPDQSNLQINFESYTNP